MGRVEFKIKKLFEIRAYRFKELVNIYKVDPKTLRKWLEAISLKYSLNKRIYLIPEIELMIEEMGFPYLIYDIDYDNSDVKCERREIKRPFEVKPYKPKELAALYNTCSKTFREQWLAPLKEDIGKLSGGYLLIPQVEKIIDTIGLPYFIYEEGQDEKPDDKKAA
jgi:hypothetical protein